MAVNFYLDKRTDKNGDAPIRVSISIRGARLLTSTGLKVSPAKWNKDKQRVKHGASNSVGLTYNVINASLAKIEDFFGHYEGQCISEGIFPTTDEIKLKFSECTPHGRKRVARCDHPQTFWDVYDLFTREMGKANSWTRATFQKFAALKHHLTDFKSSLTFADFDEPGLTAFVVFLRDTLEMKNSTIGKQLGFLKWFLRWATLKGYNANTAFQSFSPKLKTTGRKVIFLEWDELMRIFNYEVPTNGTTVKLKDAHGYEYTKIVHDATAIAKTRDIFCFCCFTSLRYSDAQNLKWSDVNDGSFTITTIKTADTITIEINKYARTILDKYKGINLPNGFVFPRITNQRMNIYLKELCELCGINQMITQTYYRGSDRIDETLPKYEIIGTHCGRRTFICNALMLGIPAEIVMKWTGHSDYKSMKPYIAIADAAKAKAMDLFNKI